MDLQHAMRSLIRGMPRIAFGGVPAERAGDGRLALNRLGARQSGIRLASDFADGAPIPFEHSADGPAIAPPLSFSGVPREARSLALIVEDPDAPTPNPFVHWLVYGISPRCGSLEDALATGAQVGRNSMLRTGWAGCAPPKGDRAHRYFFQLFALWREPRLHGIVGRSALLEAIEARIVGCGLLVGTYQR